MKHFFATLLVFATVLSANETYADTLKEVIERTLGSNPEVRVEVEKRLQADEGEVVARSGYWPRVDLRTGTGRERRENTSTKITYGGMVDQTRQEASLTISQMLFDGLATSADVERSVAKRESSAYRVAAVSEQIALKAIESYLEVLRQREIVLLTKANLAAHERTFDQIKLRTDGGIGRKADLDQIEARLALARANLISSEANLEVSQINFKLVVGELPSALVRPEPPDPALLPTDADSAVQTSLERHRLLQAAKSDIAASRAQVSVARATMLPRVDIELGSSRTNYKTPIDDPIDNSNYLMLRLRYALFSGGADTARIAEASHFSNEAIEVLRRAERQMEQTVRLSWNAYRSARDRLPNLRQHAESSRLTRDAYVKQFAIGQRSLLDMLDSENEHFTADSNHVNGQFIELFARYRLFADTGKLLDSLAIPHLPESKIDSR
jgi:adhesin transport system outer membrane protein